MTSRVLHYQQKAQSQLSQTPWVRQIQTEAISSLGGFGFPTRHDEDWKYLNTQDICNETFGPVNAGQVSEPAACPLTQVIVINDAGVDIPHALQQPLPKGVLVMPMSLAIQNHEALVKPHLSQILPIAHGFAALNMALLSTGVFIYVPKGVVIDEPLVLLHQQTMHEGSRYLRHLVVCEANSQLTLVELYQGDANKAYLTNTATEVFLSPKAVCTHYKLQLESKLAYHVGHIAVKQSMESQFSSHSISLGGKWVRSDLSIFLQEAYAKCFLNGIYAPTQGQTVDHHTSVQHLVPHCSSEQDYKGIVQGNARAIFNGKVLVAKDAQHSEAKQSNKNLLLSSKAEVDTKPQLEIYADDVVCTHGATEGQLDEEALFYLATRGIDKEEAFHYLIHAFAKDNLHYLPEGELAQYIGSLLSQHLEEA
jgi:Fe-S cluster assembly protein SufD